MRTFRYLALLVIVLMLIVVGTDFTRAADFQWITNCRFVDGGQLHYWIGYSSSEEALDDSLSYTGNGPGIHLDSVETGTWNRVIDVLLPEPDSEVNLNIAVLYNDLVWRNYGLTINAASAAPDCDAPVAVDMATITLQVDSGSYFSWQKRDPYGHWGDVAGVVTPVQDENGQRFTRLVLGADNTDHDPNDYRVTALG